jgi:type VI secretion system protein ImpC
MGNQANEEDELDVPTFRVIVVAELAPRQAFRTSEGPEPAPHAIERTTFDEVMGKLATSFVVEVPDPVDASLSPLRVDLRFDDVRSLRPDGLLEALEPVIPRAEWSRKLAPAAKANVPAAPQTNGDALDSILDKVDVAAKKPKAADKDPIGSLVSAVAKSARPPKPTSGSGGPAASSARQATADLIGSLLAHEEVRRLERLWRSVRLLVDHADRRKGVEVFVLSAADDDVDAVLDALAESETGAFDLVVLGETLTPSAHVLSRARRAAAAGEAMHSPVLASGSPELVGASDLAALGKSRRKLSATDDPRAVATRAAASDDSMRWLFVALNGPLLRAPYDAQTGRVRDLPFTQSDGDEGAWVAALPAFALAALCAKSFVATGWPTPVTAPAVMLDGLVVRNATDAGTTAALAVEAFVSDDASSELADAGLIAFGGVVNRDSAYVRSATSMFRPAAAAPKRAEGSLADALLVGTLVRGLRELAEAIPAGTPPAKIGQAAEAIVAELLSMAEPPGPEISARAIGDRLELRIKPRGFAGVTLGELSLDVPLH